MRVDNYIFYKIMKKLGTVEEAINRIKQIDYQLTKVTLTENQRILLNYERNNLIKKPKKLF